MEIPKQYNAHEAEQKWQQFWEENAVYEFDSSKKDYYVIDTPPPTVSGRMHLGHAFSYTQQDFIARYKRMRGFGVYYPFGTDDNGLATEKLVQKQRKVNLRKVPREEAIKICLEFLEEERPKFIADWKRIGMSCDFTRLYSTVDDYSRAISQKSFLDLAKKGLVYKKKGPVMWDRVFQTAIAQAELEDLKRKAWLSYIKAEFVGEEKTFVIYATTRPELLYGCVGMSIEAAGKYVKLKVGDEFWITGATTYEEKFADFEYEVVEEISGKTLEGKEVIIPISGNTVALGDDISVKADFGTGVVYYCTYGGFDCVEWMTRHPHISPIDIMNKDGKLNESCGEYAEMLCEDARKKIIADLEKSSDLIKKEKIEQTVNVGERSGAEVEYIVSEQWYVKYLDRKEEFLKASEELNWFPQHMKHRLDNWIKGLNWDWSISRQRHFGVPIPAWYDTEGKIYYADESQLPVDPLKDRPLGVADDVELIPEQDVFDTWVTSSSSPFLAINLVEDEKTRKKLFPLSLRPQAHDIINFWLFYSLAKTQLTEGENPWKDVTISGFVLDPKGEKMSKSKGNVIAPQDIIEKFSADAIRFWAATSKLGEDLPYQEKDVKTGQKTITKLWNATKFSMMHLEDYDKNATVTEVIDKWLLTKLHTTIRDVTAHLDTYEYAKARTVIEKFFWHVLCDQYLEIVKDRLYNPDTRGSEKRQSAQKALHEGVYRVIQLFAPIMPFITEELYQLFFTKDDIKSIHVTPWPEFDASLLDEVAEKQGDMAIDVINTIRKWKSERNLSMKETLQKIVLIGENVEASLTDVVDDLKAVLNVTEIVFEGETQVESENVAIKVGVVQQ